MAKSPILVSNGPPLRTFNAVAAAKILGQLRISFVHGCLALMLFASGIFSLARAQQWDDCSPSSEVKAGLDALPEPSHELTEWEFHRKELEAVQALRRQHPDNVFIERRYMKSMHDRVDRPGVIEEYKARYIASPGSPLAAYLYGVVLFGRDSPQSIKLLDSALEKDPQFPWPHIPLFWIYSAPVFRDRSKAEEHVRAFLAQCPASFEGYEQLARSDEDQAAVGKRAAQLRALIEKREDIDAIAAYRTLWTLEFKATPSSEYAGQRAQTARDIQRIRALNMQSKRQWYDVLEEGYKLTNDEKNATWAKEERASRDPSSWAPPSFIKWFEDHPYPAEDAPGKIRQTYNKDLLAQSSTWIQERPNDPFFLGMRLDALADLSGVSATEIEKAADKFFQVAQKNAGPRDLASWDYFKLAQALSRKHLQPSRVLEMAQKGLEVSEAEEKEGADDLYTDKERAVEVRFRGANYELSGLGYVSGAYIELKQPDKALIALSRMDERLQDLQSLVGENIERKESYLEQVSVYWGHMARLAELRQRKLDAMGFYENALLARLEAKQKPVPGEKDELAEDAKKLWSSLGGTDEGWTMWYGRRANDLMRSITLTWENANEPLAAFKLTDLSGKAWSLESLKGKVTFLNFWASW